MYTHAGETRACHLPHTPSTPTYLFFLGVEAHALANVGLAFQAPAIVGELEADHALLRELVVA